jgi:hypothetical protein
MWWLHGPPSTENSIIIPYKSIGAGQCVAGAQIEPTDRGMLTMQAPRGAGVADMTIAIALTPRARVAYIAADMHRTAKENLRDAQTVLHTWCRQPEWTAPMIEGGSGARLVTADRRSMLDMRDPGTGKTVEVQYIAQSGERRYRCGDNER